MLGIWKVKFSTPFDEETLTLLSDVQSGRHGRFEAAKKFSLQPAKALAALLVTRGRFSLFL
jgi:hypothetical protein